MTRPVLLLLAAIALIVAACGGSASSATPSGPAAPDHLAGTTWTVVSVNGRVSIAERRPTVSFAADQIQGNGGAMRSVGATPTTLPPGP
jgi:hypothetical protein